MKCLDLACGRGGWTKGFMAEGYDCTGIDLEPQPDYPGRFVQGDLLQVDGHEYRGFDVVIASPPCQEFSMWRMPWTMKRAVEPSLALVKACRRISDEAQPVVFILENVRSAQRWLGPAHWGRDPHYLWGDIGGVHVPNYPRIQKQHWNSKRDDLRSEIPFGLAIAVARYCTQRVLMAQHGLEIIGRT